MEREAASALQIAAATGHFELAAVLLEAGADPNEGGMGLDRAARGHLGAEGRVGGNKPEPQGSGNLSSLELGTPPGRSRRRGQRRMTQAPRAGQVLQPATSATSAQRHSCSPPRTADLELMRLLLSLGADPTMPDADGVTPLLAAAGVGTHNAGEDAGTEPEVLETLQFMLDRGADINAVDHNGETAMHGAAYRQFPWWSRYLVEKGARRSEVWNREDKYGWTPLTVASGVQRCNNIQGQAATAAAIRAVMDGPGRRARRRRPPAAGGRAGELRRREARPRC